METEIECVEGVNCVMIMTFHGQELKLASYKLLPQVPKVGDLIDGHRVTNVKKGTLPIITLRWFTDRSARSLEPEDGRLRSGVESRESDDAPGFKRAEGVVDDVTDLVE